MEQVSRTMLTVVSSWEGGSRRSWPTSEENELNLKSARRELKLTGRRSCPFPRLSSALAESTLAETR